MLVDFESSEVVARLAGVKAQKEPTENNIIVLSLLKF